MKPNQRSLDTLRGALPKGKQMKTTEPNQALQTISRTVPVAAEPLCGPALEMSDF